MIQKGDLILFRGKGFAAWCIRTATGSPWIHTENVVQVGYQLCTIGSFAPRVARRALEEVIGGRNDYIVLRPYTVHPEYESRLNHHYMTGTKYDYWGIFGQMWYHLTGRRRWRGQKEAWASDSLYCSELSAYAHGRPNWWQFWPGAFLRDPHFEIIDIG